MLSLRTSMSSNSSKIGRMRHRSTLCQCTAKLDQIASVGASCHVQTDYLAASLSTKSSCLERTESHVDCYILMSGDARKLKCIDRSVCCCAYERGHDFAFAKGWLSIWSGMSSLTAASGLGNALLATSKSGKKWMSTLATAQSTGATVTSKAERRAMGITVLAVFTLKDILSTG